MVGHSTHTRRHGSSPIPPLFWVLFFKGEITDRVGLFGAPHRTHRYALENNATWSDPYANVPHCLVEYPIPSADGQCPSTISLHSRPAPGEHRERNNCPTAAHMRHPDVMAAPEGSAGIRVESARNRDVGAASRIEGGKGHAGKASRCAGCNARDVALALRPVRRNLLVPPAIRFGCRGSRHSGQKTVSEKPANRGTVRNALCHDVDLSNDLRPRSVESPKGGTDTPF
jgi:hypothetical protein